MFEGIPSATLSQTPMPLALRIGLWAGACVFTAIAGSFAILGSFEAVRLAPIFPSGLPYFFGVPTGNVALVIGWLVYSGMTVALITSTRWRVYFLLYGAFVALLMINVAGCKQMEQGMKLTSDSPHPASRSRHALNLTRSRRGRSRGFTTFSSFSLDTLTLLRGGQVFLAGVNVVGQVVLSLIGVWVGFRLAQ